MSVPGQFDPSPPDWFFAFLGGLYAAALLAPPVAAGASLAGASLAGGYLALLGTATALTALGTLAVRRVPAAGVRLGAHTSAWALLAPAGYVVAVVAAATADAPAALLSASALGAVGTAAVGLGLSVAAGNRHARAVLDASSERAAWTAGLPRRLERRLHLVGGALGGVAVAAFAAGVWFGRPALRLGGQFALPVAVVSFTATQERTFRATPAALVVERPVQRRAIPWSRFDGYDLTDDALVLRAARPWRLDRWCDRAAIEDEERTLATLEDLLGDGEH